MKIMCRFKINKKFIWGTILFLFLGLLFPCLTLAKYESSSVEEYKQELENEGVSLPQWSLHNLRYMGMGLTRLLVGFPTLEGEEKADQGGAAKIFAGMISGVYQTKPVSSSRYLAYLSESFTLVKPAYAQGKGWKFFEPVLKIWRVVRDTSYLFFVVIFVAVGFMIMFRRKIDPQTVINIQNTLPKIIVALILVTFSYAICGLLVDFIYVGNELIEQAFDNVFVSVGGSGEGAYKGWMENFFPIDYSKTVSGTDNIFSLIIQGLQAVFKLTATLKGDFSAVFLIIIAFVFISSLVKIFFALLGRYVTLIMYTIFSPLIFLWGSLPGQEDHTSRFFKSFLSAVVTFPAILLLLNFAAVIMQAGSGLAFQEISPFTTKFTEGAIDKELTATLTAFIGLGILMATSKITEVIDDALQVKPGAGPALGAEAAGAARKIPIIGSLIG